MKHDAADTSRALAALGLPQPLRQLTRPRLDERRLLGIWQKIEQRSRPEQERRQRVLSPGRLALALSLTLLLVMGWTLLRPLAPRSPLLPLATAEGQRFESLEAGAQHGERVSFADGSQIEADPGTRIEGLAATATEFVVLLRRGRARFSVTPGGPRRWLIEARGASVEVVGTVFSVESRAGVFAVHVDAGVVLIRSSLLADGVQRLSAGQTLRLDVGLELELEPEATPAPEETGVNAPPERSAPPAARAPTRAGGEARSTRQRNARAPAQPQRANDSRSPDSAVELWARADEARRAGDAADAARLLQRLIEQFPRDSQAGLGAYTLGVLQLEQLAAPRAAAQRFRQALELGIATGLRESCYVRQVEALRHAGDEPAARQVARQYLRSFPLGEQREAMQQLISGHELLNSPRGGQSR
jgi:transmembrane sensor